jgi:hypothetical protein
VLGHGEHDEPLHAQERGRAPTTVIHVPCPFDPWVQQPQESGATGHFVDLSEGHRRNASPRLIA